MIEIKVVVELPGIPDALNNLADAVRNQPRPAITTTPAIAPMEAHDEPADAAEAVADNVTHLPVPEPATPLTEAVNEPAPVNAPVAAPKSQYTFEQISRAGADLCGAGKMAELVALLNNKYGVAAITLLAPERYEELAGDLIALGAKIGG